MNSNTRSLIEGSLANAHRALWKAAGASEEYKDVSLTDDLYSLLWEVERLSKSLVNGKPKRISPGSSASKRAYLSESQRIMRP